MVQTRSVKKRRAGRKRMGGQRLKCGHLRSTPSIAAQGERGWANMVPVLAARCAKRGLRITEQNLQAMRDHREGSVLGRLLNDKLITARMYDAGQKYHAAYLGWTGANGIPRITAPAGSYGQAVPGRSEVPDEAAEAATKVYYSASHALACGSLLAERETKRVCLEDVNPQSMVFLFLGLKRLRAHFG